MQIQCRLAYHLALLRNRSLGEEEEEEEEEEGVVVGQVGDGKRGGGEFPAVLHFRRHPFDSSCPSIFIPKSLGIPSRASGEHPASIRRASRWILIQALARDSRMMTMMMSNKNRREKEAEEEEEEEEEAEEAEEAEGAPGSCGMFQWHASRSLAAHI